MRVRRSALAPLAVVGLAWGAAGCGSSPAPAGNPAATATLSALRGVSEDGYVLGTSAAPYRLSMYLVPTSSTFASAVVPQLPQLIRESVRTGRLDVQARTLGADAATVGEDALQASRLLQAAGLQDRFFDALVRFAFGYTGTFDDVNATGLLRAAGVPDVPRALAERSSPRVARALDRATRLARAAGASETRDAYVVSDALGQQADISAQANAGHLVDGVESAIRELRRTAPPLVRGTTGGSGD